MFEFVKINPRPNTGLFTKLYCFFTFIFFLVNFLEPSQRAQTKSNPRGRGQKARQMQVQADKKIKSFNRIFNFQSPARK